MALGEFELLVLLAALRLGNEASATLVRGEIESRTGRAAPRGSVYVTLDRLTRKGYLLERSAAGAPERDGRPRRLFAVTTRGAEAARGALDGLKRMRQGVAWPDRP